jgi:hypothetical protein
MVEDYGNQDWVVDESGTGWANMGPYLAIGGMGKFYVHVGIRKEVFPGWDKPQEEEELYSEHMKLARFVASAPKLLEACETSLRLLNNLNCVESDVRRYKELLTDAIAQARGLEWW